MKSDVYAPFYSPWLCDPDFLKHYTDGAKKALAPADRCYVLYSLLKQALHVEGDCWECGVYRGGTAQIMASILSESGSTKELCLFDTFRGIPKADSSKDDHTVGQFSDTSVESVRKSLSYARCKIIPGLIPDTFCEYLERRIAFAHVDVDVYQSTRDCLEFMFPRLSPGGFMIVDDYGYKMCRGVRMAVDEYFRSPQKTKPLVLQGCQAVIFKGPT